MMNGLEKSDPCEVARKPANKPGQPGAESVERRRGAEGNTGEPHTCRTQCRGSVPQGLDRVRQAATPALPLTTRGGSRVRELRPLGSVRGVPGNRHPYRDTSIARSFRPGSSTGLRRAGKRFRLDGRIDSPIPQPYGLPSPTARCPAGRSVGS